MSAATLKTVSRAFNTTIFVIVLFLAFCSARNMADSPPGVENNSGFFECN